MQTQDLSFVGHHLAIAQKSRRIEVFVRFVYPKMMLAQGLRGMDELEDDRKW